MTEWQRAVLVVVSLVLMFQAGRLYEAGRIEQRVKAISREVQR